MSYTKHEQKISYLKSMFCTCKIQSLDPKDHKGWCPFVVWKGLKPQPKKDQEPAERR